MKTYEILVGAGANAHYIKTDATKMDVQNAINFVKAGQEHNIDKLLVALRVLGFTAREVKVEAEEVFEL